jgi:hypothetical protein
MKTSPRPKAKPLSMKRPKANPMNDRMSPQSIAARTTREMKSGGKVCKMAGGGSCRGMGAASKGGKYTKAG